MDNVLVFLSFFLQFRLVLVCKNGVTVIPKITVIWFCSGLIQSKKTMGHSDPSFFRKRRVQEFGWGEIVFFQTTKLASCCAHAQVIGETQNYLQILFLTMFLCFVDWSNLVGDVSRLVIHSVNSVSVNRTFSLKILPWSFNEAYDIIGSQPFLVYRYS